MTSTMTSNMTSNSEQKFLISCLVHNTGKIDFEAVARENGYSNPRSASNRLFAIKKSVTTGTSCSSNDKPVVDTDVTRDGKVTKRKPRKNRKTRGIKTEKTTESTNYEEMREEEGTKG